MTEKEKTPPAPVGAKKTYFFKTLSSTQIAWLAGLFQAEANFTLDKRVHSKSQHPDYKPPPPVPKVKLEMIEKDLMEHVGKMVEENVVKQERKTTANNDVYRLTIQAREKTEVFLRTIEPFVVGNKTKEKIKQLLSICDAYNQWLADGGKSKAASLAARLKHQKLHHQNPTKDQERTNLD